MRGVLSILMLAGCVLILAGCSATRWEETDAPPAQSTNTQNKVSNTAPASQDMTKASRGNPPFYKVFGVRYEVMDSNEGYKEQGIASWYGKKFHGRSTSSGEKYNMYAMTAAHKSLPLPTNVRVTNISNGRSIVVRVNDRGPFAKGRIIDLSYKAALELDMISTGTTLVEVETIPLGRGGSGTVLAANQQSVAVAPTVVQDRSKAVNMFIQVGAFGESANAQSLATRLTNSGVGQVAVQQSAGQMPMLYRVRVGPFTTVSDYDRILAQIENLQITDSKLVVED